MKMHFRSTVCSGRERGDCWFRFIGFDEAGQWAN